MRAARPPPSHPSRGAPPLPPRGGRGVGGGAGASGTNRLKSGLANSPPPSPPRPPPKTARPRASPSPPPPPTGVDLAAVRGAIHEARKMAIDYADDKGRRTQRTIWPIAMAYYVDVSLIGAWCELRQDFRSFRVDRIIGSRLLDEHFAPDQGRLTAAWLALSKDAPGTPT